MNGIQTLFLSQAAAYALAASRIAGFLVSSPFPGNHVSSTQKLGLLAVLSWLAASYLPTAGVPHGLDARLAMSAMSEVVCGIVIGFVFHVIFAAAEVLGTLLSQATGLSVPSVMDPALEQQDAVLTRIVTLAAMLVALSIGAHRVAISYLLESFRAIPLGRDIHPAAAAGTFVDLGAEAVSVGLRLALPVVGVALVTQTALALVARAAPSLQIFNVGLSVVLVATFAVLGASLDGIGSGLVAHFATLAPRIDQVLFEMTR